MFSVDSDSECKHGFFLLFQLTEKWLCRYIYEFTASPECVHAALLTSSGSGEQQLDCGEACDTFTSVEDLSS